MTDKILAISDQNYGVWKMQDNCVWVVCIACYDVGAYSKLQFMRAISSSLGIHSDGFLAEEISDDDENDCVNVDEQQQQQQCSSYVKHSSSWRHVGQVWRVSPRPVSASCWCLEGTRVSVLSVLTLWPLCRPDVRCVAHLLTWLCACTVDVYLANLNVWHNMKHIVRHSPNLTTLLTRITVDIAYKKLLKILLGMCVFMSQSS